jgi:hypothetical protein
MDNQPPGQTPTQQSAIEAGAHESLKPIAMTILLLSIIAIPANWPR